MGRVLVLLDASLAPAAVNLAQRHAATATHPRCVFWHPAMATANKTPHRPAPTVLPVRNRVHNRPIVAADASDGLVVLPPSAHGQ